MPTYFIVMFQYENEAKSFYEVLKKRLLRFNLELEENKTRKGKYIVKHKTSKKKMKTKRKEFKMWMKENMHKPVYEIMEIIKRKLIGHYNYYGINNNSKSICDYYIYVKLTTYRIWNGFLMPIPHIKVNVG